MFPRDECLTYRTVLEVEPLCGLSKNLGVEVHEESPDGVLVGFPDARPQGMLSLNDLAPLSFRA